MTVFVWILLFFFCVLLLPEADNINHHICKHWQELHWFLYWSSWQEGTTESVGLLRLMNLIYGKWSRYSICSLRVTCLFPSPHVLGQYHTELIGETYFSDWIFGFNCGCSCLADDSASADINDDQTCPRNRDEASISGRTCLRKCITDADCISNRKRCLCDGKCGWSCVRPGKWCPHWLALSVFNCNGFQYSCTDLTCADLSPLLNGKYHMAGNFFNSHVTYECDDGYYLSGGVERICQGDASWSASAPECKSKREYSPGTGSRYIDSEQVNILWILLFLVACLHAWTMNEWTRRERESQTVILVIPSGWILFVSSGKV